MHCLLFHHKYWSFASGLMPQIAAPETRSWDRNQNRYDFRRGQALREVPAAGGAAGRGDAWVGRWAVWAAASRFSLISHARSIPRQTPSLIRKYRRTKPMMSSSHMLSMLHLLHGCFRRSVPQAHGCLPRGLVACPHGLLGAQSVGFVVRSSCRVGLAVEDRIQ